jgi:hypothetical protein
MAASCRLGLRSKRDIIGRRIFRKSIYFPIISSLKVEQKNQNQMNTDAFILVYLVVE